MRMHKYTHTIYTAHFRFLFTPHHLARNRLHRTMYNCSLLLARFGFLFCVIQLSLSQLLDTLREWRLIGVAGELGRRKSFKER